MHRFKPPSNFSFLHTFLLWKPWLHFLMSLSWFLCSKFIYKMKFSNFTSKWYHRWLPFCLIYSPDFRPWCWERPYFNSLLLSFSCLSIARLPYPFICPWTIWPPHCLDYWSILGALGNAGVPVSFLIEVSSALRAWHGWPDDLNALFLFIVSQGALVPLSR